MHTAQCQQMRSSRAAEIQCGLIGKITFGANFSFDGNGSCPDGYKLEMPASSGVNGWDGKWYNAQTGEGYLPAEIPEETAAVYLAVNPNP